jgi:hypothetical protein
MTHGNRFSTAYILWGKNGGLAMTQATYRECLQLAVQAGWSPELPFESYFTPRIRVCAEDNHGLAEAFAFGAERLKAALAGALNDEFPELSEYFRSNPDSVPDWKMGGYLLDDVSAAGERVRGKDIREWRCEKTTGTRLP